MQYIRLLLFYSVIFQSCKFQSPIFSTKMTKMRKNGVLSQFRPLYRPVVALVESVTRHHCRNALSAAAGEKISGRAVVVRRHAHLAFVPQLETDVVRTAAFHTVAARRTHVRTAAVVVLARVTACNRHQHLQFYHGGSVHFDVVVPCAACLLYTSPSPRDRQKSRMPSSA